MLALLALSQVPVTLLGEGVRDLSKHLAGAQYAVDLMLVLLVAQGAAAVARRARPQAPVLSDGTSATHVASVTRTGP